MSDAILQFRQQLATTNKLEFQDYAFMNAAIANIGNVTVQHGPDGKRLKDPDGKDVDIDLNKLKLDSTDPNEVTLRSLAHKAVTTAPFAENSVASGEKGLMVKYVDDLIERSKKIDQEQGVPEGTNLRAFMSDSREATRALDFERFKKEPTTYGAELQASGQLEAVKKAIRKSANAHIDHNLLDEQGTKGIDIADDFVNSVKAKPSAGLGHEDRYADAEAHEAKPMQGGIMQLILMFIGMLLGIDMGQFFGGGQSQEQQTANAGNAVATAAERQGAPIDTQHLREETGATTPPAAGKDFGALLRDNKLDATELRSLLANPETGAATAASSAITDNLVVLTPDAKDGKLGKSYIQATQEADGSLKNIQVVTEIDGKKEYREVKNDAEGVKDLRLAQDGSNNVAVANAILNAAKDPNKSQSVDISKVPNYTADNTVSGVAAAFAQQQRSQTTTR
ncbi:MAG: hypothetical protein SFT92_04845 [Rickettsiales bacterium]|nr:hypothetical protein [Rickettsiales bacterium]